VWAVDRLIGGYAGRRVEVVATMSFTLRHVQATQWKRACDITVALVWMCSCGASKATSSTSLAAMLGIHASPSWVPTEERAGLGSTTPRLTASVRELSDVSFMFPRPAAPATSTILGTATYNAVSTDSKKEQRLQPKRLLRWHYSGTERPSLALLRLQLLG
jgi:general stress protein 26